MAVESTSYRQVGLLEWLAYLDSHPEMTWYVGHGIRLGFVGKTLLAQELTDMDDTLLLITD